MKYSKLSLGTVEAVFNKLGGMDGALSFLRGDLSANQVPQYRKDEDGHIYFDILSFQEDGSAEIDYSAVLISTNVLDAANSVGLADTALELGYNIIPPKGLVSKVEDMFGNRMLKEWGFDFIASTRYDNCRFDQEKEICFYGNQQPSVFGRTVGNGAWCGTDFYWPNNGALLFVQRLK